MGLIRSLVRESSGLATPEKWLVDWFRGGLRTAAGIDVNHSNALTSTAFFGGVRVIAEDVGSLPLITYERLQPRGKRRANDHALYELLHDQPNPLMPASQFREALQGHVETWGSGYAYIVRRRGIVRELWPLRPDRMKVDAKRTGPGNLRLTYGYDDPVNGIKATLLPDEVLHVAGPGFDGIRGYSLVALHRNAIGLALATEHYGSSFFRNGARPGGVLHAPREMSDPARARLKADFEAIHRGLDNAQRVAILEEGVKWESVGIPNEDAQFLECVMPGTLVSMADGRRLPVEDLRPGDEVIAWQDDGPAVSRVAAVGTPPLKPLVRIRTARGRTLTASHDHPCLALRRLRTPGGRPAPAEPTWVPIGELTPGNFVRVALGAPPTRRSLPTDRAWFLGAMVGDGYIRDGGLGFANHDVGVVEEMRRVLRMLGGDLTPSGREGDWYVATGARGRRGGEVRRLLNDAGLVGSRSHTKRVPALVNAGGPAAWRGFLAGYLDTDGSVGLPGEGKQPAVCWTSTSRALLDDVQHLLALLGVQSGVYDHQPEHDKVIRGQAVHGRRTWTLYVTGCAQLRTLGGLLDPAHVEKRRRLEKLQGLPSSRYRPANWDYDRVVEVERLPAGPTVGVEIEGTHTHVTSGLVTHNTRTFQIGEMARILRLPPHKLAELSRATFSNIEHQALDYVVSSLRPRLVRWEQAIRSKLFTPRERAQFFAEHLVDGLLRGDQKSRHEAYSTARQWGWMSADDIRELENMNPLPNGKGSVYLVPLNMVPAPSPDEAAAAGARSSRGRERSAEARRRIARAFVPLVEDIDRRFARMEQSEVEALVRRHLDDRGRATADFEAELEALYDDLNPRAVDRWRPLMTALAREVATDTADDLGLADDLSEMVERFAGAYTVSHVGYRTAASVGQLRDLLGGADPARAIRGRLDEWVADRPARTALWETVQLPEATAREVWRRGGVTKMRWRAGGGDTCAFCSELDGKVVGVEQTFLAAGAEVPGGDGSLKAPRNIFHPPAHLGCDCQIEAVT